MKPALALACLLILALAACGGGGGNKATSSTSAGEQRAGGGRARVAPSPHAKQIDDQTSKSFAASQSRAQKELGSDPALAGKGAFNHVLAELPIREPPLRVQQYIVDQGHDVIARPNAKDFFCGRTLADRLAVVAAFYREADKRFRARGINDFELTVAPLSSNYDTIRVLAVGKNRKVRLTRHGRARGPC